MLYPDRSQIDLNLNAPSPTTPTWTMSGGASRSPTGRVTRPCRPRPNHSRRPRASCGFGLADNALSSLMATFEDGEFDPASRQRVVVSQTRISGQVLRITNTTSPSMGGAEIKVFVHIPLRHAGFRSAPPALRATSP